MEAIIYLLISVIAVLGIAFILQSRLNKSQLLKIDTLNKLLQAKQQQIEYLKKNAVPEEA